MSLVQRDCWHCDRCGHEWLVQVVNKPPIFCSKCHQRNWNRNPQLERSFFIQEGDGLNIRIAEELPGPTYRELMWGRITPSESVQGQELVRLVLEQIDERDDDIEFVHPPTHCVPTGELKEAVKTFVINIERAHGVKAWAHFKYRSADDTPAVQDVNKTASKVVHAIYTSHSGERSRTYCGRDIESVTTAGVDANDEVVLDGITCKLCLRHNEGHAGDDVRPVKSSTPFVQISTSISQQKALDECTQESNDVFTEEEAAIYNEHVRVTGTTLRVPLTFVPILVEKLTDYFLSNNTHDRAYKHGSAAQNLARALTEGRYKLLLKASPNGHKDTSDDLMQRLDREIKVE